MTQIELIFGIIIPIALMIIGLLVCWLYDKFYKMIDLSWVILCFTFIYVFYEIFIEIKLCESFIVVYLKHTTEPSHVLIFFIMIAVMLIVLSFLLGCLMHDKELTINNQKKIKIRYQEKSLTKREKRELEENEDNNCFANRIKELLSKFLRFCIFYFLLIMTVFCFTFSFWYFVFYFHEFFVS